MCYIATTYSIYLCVFYRCYYYASVFSLATGFLTRLALVSGVLVSPLTHPLSTLTLTLPWTSTPRRPPPFIVSLSLNSTLGCSKKAQVIGFQVNAWSEQGCDFKSFATFADFKFSLKNFWEQILNYVKTCTRLCHKPYFSLSA